MTQPFGKQSRTHELETVGHAAHPVPGKRTLVEQLQVQQAHATEDQPAAVHAAAGRGVATSSSPLPFGDVIQRAFGRHDVSAIQAHTGSEAAASTRAMGADAYATGDHVVLGGAADLHTVAHEAAHVVQQRGGVQLKGGVGKAGDAHEHHADQVADRVVQGASAEDLLDGYAAPGPSASPVQRTPSAVQRAVVTYTSADAPTPLADLAKHLDDKVAQAVAIIAANPALSSVPGSDAGYLAAWVTTYNAYLAKPSEIPPFFYARYGYAVETIATGLLGERFGSLTLKQQVAHGHTRPDVVAFDGTNEVAWLDITSEGSQGHILKKQHSGWQTRPYVAEVVYKMPNPSDLAQASGTLTEDQKKELAAADANATRRAAELELARNELGVAIAGALYDDYSANGQISKTRAREIIHKACKDAVTAVGLDINVTGPAALGVTALLGDLEVGTEVAPGDSWAKWAGQPNLAAGRDLLQAYGARKAAGLST